MTQSLLERIKSKRQAIAAKNTERPEKLKSDKNLIRIMPNWKGDPDGSFYHDFGQHYIKNSAGKVEAVYICTANTFGKPCDVCQAIAGAAANLDPSDEPGAKLIYEARGGNRVLVNAIYRNGSHANAKTDPVLLELPPSAFDMVLNIAEEYLSNHDINIFALDSGYDITITKTGSGKDTKYGVVCSPKPSAVPESALAKCKDLDAYVNQEYDAGKQKALMAVRTVFYPHAPALVAPSTAPSLPKEIAQDLGGGAELLPASRPVSRLAAAAPVDMEEVDLSDVPLKAETAPVTKGKSAAEAELDELEALLKGEAA